MGDSRDGRLAGKVALITGGSSGIGRACAERYAEEGADIVIADRDARRGAEAVDAIRAAANNRVLFVEVDVADEASVEAMVERAIGELGRSTRCSPPPESRMPATSAARRARATPTRPRACW
jgi:NAD(P)-dependent dehydrogenase (short-subunit alcohol dehydrogenase family)